MKNRVARAGEHGQVLPQNLVAVRSNPQLLEKDPELSQELSQIPPIGHYNILEFWFLLASE